LNVYKEAPVAIFLAGVVGLVLTILSSKLAIYPRSKLASFFLWPLFLFVGEGMTQFEKKLCFKYAFSGGLLTAFCMVIWIIMV